MGKQDMIFKSQPFMGVFQIEFIKTFQPNYIDKQDRLSYPACVRLELHTKPSCKKIKGGNAMAKMKTIRIEAKLDEKFKVDVKAGNHTLYVDQPKAGGGNDEGPNPIEYLLTSLAGCIATTARIIALQKKINLKGMDINIEGSFDTEIILGKSRENRPGLTGINVTLNIDSDMSKSEKEAFVHDIESRCPILDNIANTTPVKVEIS